MPLYSTHNDGDALALLGAESAVVAMDILYWCCGLRLGHKRYLAKVQSAKV